MSLSVHMRKMGEEGQSSYEFVWLSADSFLPHISFASFSLYNFAGKQWSVSENHKALSKH